MAEIKVDLPAGSRFGDRVAKVAWLRELTTADIIGAGEDAEKCVLGPDGAYHLVASPTMSGVHLLRRQIARLDDADGTVIDGPLSLQMFIRLDQADFLTIQAKADELDRAGQAALAKAEERGRGEPAS